MSYADTILRVTTDRGERTLRAHKITDLIALDGSTTQVVYLGGPKGAEMERRATVLTPFDELYEAWIGCLRSWSAQDGGE